MMILPISCCSSSSMFTWQSLGHFDWWKTIFLVFRTFLLGCEDRAIEGLARSRISVGLRVLIALFDLDFALCDLDEARDCLSFCLMADWRPSNWSVWSMICMIWSASFIFEDLKGYSPSWLWVFVTVLSSGGNLTRTGDVTVFDDFGFRVMFVLGSKPPRLSTSNELTVILVLASSGTSI